MRVGLGYDIHPLVKGRRFVLGGVEIPFEKGPLGHSDGDCLFHAIADALLGAAGLGDMGRYFPDDDRRWKDADSSDFLRDVRSRLKGIGLEIQNLDANILLEEPKLAPYLPKMIENIAELLGIDPSRTNLKAKRGEGIDAVGRGEAVAAQVVVLLQEPSSHAA